MVLKYVFLYNSARKLYITETFVRHVEQFKLAYNTDKKKSLFLKFVHACRLLQSMLKNNFKCPLLSLNSQNVLITIYNSEGNLHVNILPAAYGKS